MTDLLGEEPIQILEGVWYLPGFVSPADNLPLLMQIVSQCPLRHMTTPGGHRMSAAMTNCGDYGWVSDRAGYRYECRDPQTGRRWPQLPTAWSRMSAQAAQVAGFSDFRADVCLINRYAPGDSMGAHQDRDELDFTQPIVSVSLGIPARFFLLGPVRKGKATPVDLVSGDVIVFGGSARLYYHGVRRIKQNTDPLFGAYRYNLTFRAARSSPVA